MHKEILTKSQVELLPYVKEFSRDFYLVGGTAIALHLGHRQSIDFDLFTAEDFDPVKITRRLGNVGYAKIERTFVKNEREYTVLVKGVKMTFFSYPYAIPADLLFEKIARLPDLLTLAAMKAYALGRRAKWKDYVDMYFILKDRHSLSEIGKKGDEIFGNEFNEKIFRESLAYFDDINYDEKIIYMPGFEVGDEEIEEKLLEFSVG